MDFVLRRKKNGAPSKPSLERWDCHTGISEILAWSLCKGGRWRGKSGCRWAGVQVTSMVLVRTRRKQDGRANIQTQENHDSLEMAW